jgi:hypothetical protein
MKKRHSNIHRSNSIGLTSKAFIRVNLIRSILILPKNNTYNNKIMFKMNSSRTMNKKKRKKDYIDKN